MLGFCLEPVLPHHENLVQVMLAAESGCKLVCMFLGTLSSDYRSLIQWIDAEPSSAPACGADENSLVKSKGRETSYAVAIKLGKDYYAARNCKISVCVG